MSEYPTQANKCAQIAGTYDAYTIGVIREQMRQTEEENKRAMMVAERQAQLTACEPKRHTLSETMQEIQHTAIEGICIANRIRYALYGTADPDGSECCPKPDGIESRARSALEDMQELNKLLYGIAERLGE